MFPIRAFLLPWSLLFNNADCVNDGAVFLTTVLEDPAVRQGLAPAPFFIADVAQMAEQLSCKQQVVRSRLIISSKFLAPECRRPGGRHSGNRASCTIVLQGGQAPEENVRPGEAFTGEIRCL